MRRILHLPFTVVLLGVAALSMLVPALHALVLREHEVARAFFYSALGLFFVTSLLGMAFYDRPLHERQRGYLWALIGAYAVLPPFLALPFYLSATDTVFGDAWFEMLSQFTTTGATLYDTFGRLPQSLHLWRGLVAWLGGFYTLLMALAILMPLNLGGMEVMTGYTGEGSGTQLTRISDPTDRIIRFFRLIFPAYIGFTALLWFGLVMVGENSFHAFMMSMAIISTSGVVPDGAQGVLHSGIGGEMLIALFLFLGISRRGYPGAFFADADRKIWKDPEIVMAALLIGTVTAVLLLRHWIGAIEKSDGQNIWAFLRVLWGIAYTSLSFLATVGLPSEQWALAHIWSGLSTHGLILTGLALVGGGVATTAGGVKLLRVYALMRHGRRELEKLIHPHSIGGGGSAARRLRGDGAHIAWVFFMLFAASLAVIVGALALSGLEFEPALVLGVSALSTTGQLAGFAGEVPVRYATLGAEAKVIVGVAMVMGRMETLTVLALLAPGIWRR